jgi:hypothetical protein
VIKIPTNVLASSAQIPMHKHKKYEKQGNMTPPKLNNSTARNTNGSEVDDVSDKEFRK